MTAAFNLSQLANNLNTSGQLDATDGLSGAVPVANGGTGATSLTANNVLLGNGTGALQTVAPGTSGNVLTSTGTSWVSQAAPVGGSWNLISTVTASGVTIVEFTSGITDTYATYVLVGSNMYANGGSNNVFLVQFRTGSTYVTSSDYLYSYFTGTNSYVSSSGTTGILVTPQNYPSGFYNNFGFQLTIYRPQNSLNGYVPCFLQTSCFRDAYNNWMVGSGVAGSGTFYNNSINGIRVLAQSSNQLNGILSLYGVKK